MSIYNEGDLIEATKGDRRVIDRATKSTIADELYLPLMAGGPYLPTMESGGWTLAIIEKAAPALPTEPGWYRSSGLGADKVDGLLHLSDRGDWTWVGNMFAVNPDRLTDKQARQHLPLNRLEPVADTAKKFRAAYLAHTSGFDRSALICDKAIDAIAAEFGVTS